ncbi:hypothetical protein AOC36_10625 [Erysipelothrix larvae]|uniref:PTS EIIA type-4 domain-containing protein n=1 Tax=Erysipelothrix larvae TaxID=1514105 RepID=A0A0X8H216_9FIRM|nr:PTS sugar transporter subunit IIA [Erysipelothrix larvae]AMC94409.1 hypothetical protein AOC36_10625 [Erysipelothrix larvae]
MNRQLLIISHGYLAEHFLNAAKMIVGDISNAESICMTHDMGLDQTLEKISDYFNIHKNEEILVLADLFGGTPFNAAVVAKKDRQDIEIITGVNLGMIIEYVTSQNLGLQEISDHLKEVGRNGVQGQMYDFDDDEIDF